MQFVKVTVRLLEVSYRSGKISDTIKWGLDLESEFYGFIVERPADITRREGKKQVNT